MVRVGVIIRNDMDKAWHVTWGHNEFHDGRKKTFLLRNQFKLTIILLTLFNCLTFLHHHGRKYWLNYLVRSNSFITRYTKATFLFYYEIEDREKIICLKVLNLNIWLVGLDMYIFVQVQEGKSFDVVYNNLNPRTCFLLLHRNLLSGDVTSSIYYPIS